MKSYFEGEIFEPYEEECQRCYGTGKKQFYSSEEECIFCKGKGYVLSFKGERFIEFLKRRLIVEIK